MNNTIYYFIFSLFILFFFGIYANEVRKKSFVSDSTLKCVMIGECPENIKFSAKFSEQLENNFSCNELLEKYLLDSFSEHLFFMKYIGITLIMKNGLILDKKDGYFTCDILIQGNKTSRIFFLIEDDIYKIQKIEGVCEVFEEVECIINKS